MQVEQLLPVILYLLLYILIIAVTIFIIRCIYLLKKVDQLVDDMNYKMRTLNGVFEVIETSTDTIKQTSNKIIKFIVSTVKKIFRKDEE